MNNKVKFSIRIHQGGYSYQSLRRIWIEADRLGYYSATPVRSTQRAYSGVLDYPLGPGCGDKPDQAHAPGAGEYLP